MQTQQINLLYCRSARLWLKWMTRSRRSAGFDSNINVEWEIVTQLNTRQTRSAILNIKISKAGHRYLSAVPTVGRSFIFQIANWQLQFLLHNVLTLKKVWRAKNRNAKHLYCTLGLCFRFICKWQNPGTSLNNLAIVLLTQNADFRFCHYPALSLQTLARHPLNWSNSKLCKIKLNAPHFCSLKTTYAESINTRLF